VLRTAALRGRVVRRRAAPRRHGRLTRPPASEDRRPAQPAEDRSRGDRSGG